MAIVKNMLVRLGLDANGLTGGMKQAKEKINSELTSISKSSEKLNGLGSALSGAFDGAAAELEKNQTEMQRLTAYSDALQAKMYTVFHQDGADVAAFTALNAENERVNSQLDKLQSKIEVLKVQAEFAAQSAADSIRQVGDATEESTNPKKVNLFARAWEHLFGPVENIVPSLKNVGNVLLLLPVKVVSNLGTALGKVAAGTVRAAGSGLSKLVTGIKNLASHSKSSENGIGGLVSSLKKIGGVAIGLRLVSSIFGRLRSIVSSYISENSALNAQVEQLKASLGQALAPAINVVTNAFAALMPYIVGVSNAIGELLSNLFGSGWGAVTEGANAAASATSGAAAAQKDYNKQLMGFDQITKVDDQSSSGGGGSNKSTVTPVEGKLPTWLTDLGTKVKEAIGAGDWAGAATAITSQLNDLLAGIDWGEWGTKLGGYLDSGLTFLSTAITTFDWHSLGSDLAESVNGIISNVDWSNLGVILGAKFQIAIEGLGGFFEKLDWSAAGSGLADGFSGLWNSIDWKQAGKTVSDGAIGVLTSITTAIQEIDWYQMGKDVLSFIENIDWNGLTDQLFEGIGSAIGGIGSFLWGLIEDAWNDTKDYWEEKVNNAGGDVGQGILDGIAEIFTDIGTWFKEHVLDPFVSGFKKCFNIHSPAKETTLVEAAKNVALGILGGIAEPFEKIADWVDTHILQPLKKALDPDGPIATFVVGVADTASEWWENVKSWWSEKTNAGKEAVGEFTAKVKNTASTWWGNVKSWWSNTTSNGAAAVGEFTAKVKNTASTWWGNVKSWWSNKTSNGAASVGEFTSKLKNTASTWWSNAKSWWSTQSQNGLSVSAGVKLIKDGWTSITDFIGAITKTITIKIAWKTSGLNGLESAISKYLFAGKGFPTGLRFAARGGVVQSAALFGNTVIGEDGKEAIVPLERNTEWANVVAQKIAGILGSGGGNQREPIVVYVTLDGKIVGRTAVNYINGQYVTTGVSPIMI